LHLLGAGALERETGEEAEFGFVDLLDAVDEFREIVFEELFALGGEGGDVFLLVGLGDDEAEEELFAALLGDLGGETGGRGLFLVGGVGARVMTLRVSLPRPARTYWRSISCTRVA
jgi:hypothetical protein